MIESSVYVEMVYDMCATICKEFHELYIYIIILYYIMLYYVILYYIILCYIMLCYIILYYITSTCRKDHACHVSI